METQKKELEGEHTKCKEKGKITIWGDVPDDENDQEEEEGTFSTTIVVEFGKDHKMLIDAMKSLNRDHFDILPTYNEIFNGEELIDFIDAFNINCIDRYENVLADFLANVVAKQGIIPYEDITQVEIKNRPMVLDNAHN